MYEWVGHTAQLRGGEFGHANRLGSRARATLCLSRALAAVHAVQWPSLYGLDGCSPYRTPYRLTSVESLDGTGAVTVRRHHVYGTVRSSSAHTEGEGGTLRFMHTGPRRNAGYRKSVRATVSGGGVHVSVESFFVSAGVAGV